MKVQYKGKTSDYDYRIAEIEFNDQEEKKVERIAFLMHIKGWTIDIITDGYALARVDGKDEYNEFMIEWKAAKKCITDCIKYGF